MLLGDFDVYTQNWEIKRSKLAGSGILLKHLISAKTLMFMDVMGKIKAELDKVASIKKMQRNVPPEGLLFTDFEF